MIYLTPFMQNGLENDMRNPRIKFKFIGLDGNEYTFQTEINTLNNRHMWTINDYRDCYSSNKREVNSVIKDIKKNCKIIEETS